MPNTLAGEAGEDNGGVEEMTGGYAAFTAQARNSSIS